MGPELVAFYYWLLSFKKADANDDGVLSLKEFKKASAKRKLEMQQTVDPSEVHAEGKTHFKRLDLDGDKLLSHREYAAWLSGAYQASMAFQQLVDIADKDKDEHLSREELVEIR